MNTVVTKSNLKSALLRKYQRNVPTARFHAGTEQIITVEFDYNYVGNDGLEVIYCAPYKLDFTTKPSRENPHYCIDLNFIFESLSASNKVLAAVGPSQTMIGEFKVTVSKDYHPTAWRKHVKVELASFQEDYAGIKVPSGWKPSGYSSDVSTK